MLCGRHHRLVHHSEWRIDMIGGIPQFHPPSWLGGPPRRNPSTPHATHSNPGITLPIRGDQRKPRRYDIGRLRGRDSADRTRWPNHSVSRSGSGCQQLRESGLVLLFGGEGNEFLFRVVGQLQNDVVEGEVAEGGVVDSFGPGTEWGDVVARPPRSYFGAWRRIRSACCNVSGRCSGARSKTRWCPLPGCWAGALQPAGSRDADRSAAVGRVR